MTAGGGFYFETDFSHYYESSLGCLYFEELNRIEAKKSVSQTKSLVMYVLVLLILILNALPVAYFMPHISFCEITTSKYFSGTAIYTEDCGEWCCVLYHHSFDSK